MDDMADEGNADTFEYTLGGREFIFNRVDRGQIIMLQRYVDTQRAKAAVMRDAGDLDGVIGVGKKISDATWITIESQFTNPEDLEWVQMEIMAKRLDERDLLPLLSGGIKTVEAEDDADPAPVKRAGRKAPAKKAAKKASPPRAAR